MQTANLVTSDSLFYFLTSKPSEKEDLMSEIPTHNRKYRRLMKILKVLTKLAWLIWQILKMIQDLT